MQKSVISVIILFTLFPFNAFSQSPIPYNLVGYATMNGGTTGGQGGTTVTVSTLADFKMYAEESNTPYTILVSGHLISGDDKGASIKVASNKTIIGIGSDAFLDGIGFNISSKRNIIIRNLKFTMTSITNTTDPAVYDVDGDEGRPQIIVNSGDCIKIQSTSENIWIDHCEFFNIDPAVQTNQDLYDGLVDVSGHSRYITISWCYFHDHHKSNLIGSSDGDNFNRLMTFHHNYFYKIGQRTPSYRFGTGHFFNNYALSIKSSGVNSRMGACLRVENNVFESSVSPIVATAGFLHLIGNSYITSSGSLPVTSTCSHLPEYDYSLVIQNTPDVKSTVQQYAGVGIFTSQNFQSGSIGITSPVTNTTFTSPASFTIAADASAGQGTVAKVQFYNGDILLGEDATFPYTYEWNSVSAGSYTIKAVVTDDLGQNATSVPRVINVTSINGLSNPLLKIFKEVHPNPSENTFTIRATEKIKNIRIINLYGQVIDQMENILPGQNIEIGGSWKTGTYTIRAEYNSERIEVAKLVKLN